MLAEASALPKSIIPLVQDVLTKEAQSILDAVDRIDGAFDRAVNIILGIKGRLIVTGMGKPGYIAHKISATLASTGTPSFYLHPAEAMHGDLGMVTAEDAIVIISNSGETPEILTILPTLKRTGLPIIAICGNPASTLATYSDVVISSAVREESCPLNLAPTNSTTLSLALGDALAVTLMKIRGFTKENFAVYHPGGALGKRLLLTVKEVMKAGEQKCVVDEKTSVIDTLFSMTAHRSGAVSVVNEQGELIGIVTDGDIRRYIMYNNIFHDEPVMEVMKTSPCHIYEDQLVDEALRMMEQHKPAPITVLPVLNRRRQVTGLLHITDLLKEKVI